MFFKKFISLDIGNKNIKIVTGKARRNKVYVDSTSSMATPPNCVEDGRIVDKKRLIPVIQDMIGMNNLKIKDAICTTNSSNIISRELIVPDAEDEELDTIVEFEVQQYIPIILDEHILQYNILEKVIDKENDIDKLRIFAASYPKFISEQYLELLEALKLKPTSLDINFNALSKLFKLETEINGKIQLQEEGIAVIDMGHENIDVDIVSNGNIEFNRTISSGGGSLTKSIASQYKVSINEAEKIKKNYCDLEEEHLGEEYKLLNELARESINIWIEEIRRIFQYYKNKRVSNRIDKVYLYGGGSRLKGLTQYMSESLNLPVDKINSMGNIVVGKNSNIEDLDYYLNAIGALIRL